MSRLRRIETADRIFFVTTNVAPGVQSFSEAERSVILNSLDDLRQEFEFLLFGYVVMPNQVTQPEENNLTPKGVSYDFNGVSLS